MGRLLIRGEHGHDIIDALAPAPGEIVIDKASFGAFCARTWSRSCAPARGHPGLRRRDGDVCVHTTLREAYDRWFHCNYVADAISCFDPEIRRPAPR